MITHFRHAGIVVADIDRALIFWRDVLGFRVVRRMEESGAYLDALTGLDRATATTIKLAAPDGTLVELLQFRSHPDRPDWAGRACSTGLTHLAFTVDDLDAEYCRLCDAGVRFMCPPKISPDGNVKVTYGSGPEGILLELVQVLRT